MDAKQFLAEFRHIASAPGGLQRLRELILQLAVSGYLVQRDEDEEPVEVALAEAERHRVRFGTDFELRRIPLRPELRENERPYMIPAHWRWRRLEQIACYIQRGKGPSYANSGSTFVVSQKCIRWKGFDLSAARYVDESSLKSYGKERFLQPSDLLWNSTGTGTVGRVAIYNEKEDVRAVADSHVTVIRLSNFVPRYVWCVIAAPWVQARIAPDHKSSIVSGTTKQVELATSSVRALAIPCPPIAEQKRIVAKVDELMALCDKLEAQQQERQTMCNLTFMKTLDTLTSAENSEVLHGAWRSLYDRLHLLNDGAESVATLKKTIFDLAVKGNLSTLAEDDIPVTQLLFEIDTAGKWMETGRGKTRISIQDSTDDLDRPFEIPSHWKWVRLGRLAKLVEYGTSQKAHEEPRGIPVLRMGNLIDGRINYSNLKYVADDIDGLPKLFLKPNDLIFNRTNSYELVGKMSLFEGESDAFTFASYLIRITLFAEWINPHYINLYFQSSLCRRHQIEPNITVQTNQANFNGTKLKAVLVPLPPLEEQNRIVDSVNKLISLCDRLKQLHQGLAKSGGTLARAYVSAITGIRIEEKEKMKAPKTELVSNLRIGEVTPTNKEQAPLTTILIKHRELSAKALWNTSGLEIGDFYQQLKTEMAKGWIVQPEVAYVKVVEAS